MTSTRKLSQTHDTDSEPEKHWSYETLLVSMPHPAVAHVELNRPQRGNAMNNTFWRYGCMVHIYKYSEEWVKASLWHNWLLFWFHREMVECFSNLGSDKDIRAIVISGRGKIFSGGLDLTSMVQEVPEFFDASKDSARRAKDLAKLIRSFQQSFTQIEQVLV